MLPCEKFFGILEILKNEFKKIGQYENPVKNFLCAKFLG